MARVIHWRDLPKPLNLFTVRNATLRDLDTGDIIQFYSSNTRITVAQEAVVDGTLYYRTETMAEHGLNRAFRASAFFEKPIEKAPLAPTTPPCGRKHSRPYTHSPAEKQTQADIVVLPKSGEGGQKMSWFKRLFSKKKM